MGHKILVIAVENTKVGAQMYKGSMAPPLRSSVMVCCGTVKVRAGEVQSRE